MEPPLAAFSPAPASLPVVDYSRPATPPGTKLGCIALAIVLLAVGVVGVAILYRSQPEGTAPLWTLGSGYKQTIQTYLRDKANDPDSLEIVEWGAPEMVDGATKVKVRLRAKNVFGAKMMQEMTFAVKDGKVVEVDGNSITPEELTQERFAGRNYASRSTATGSLPTVARPVALCRLATGGWSITDETKAALVIPVMRRSRSHNSWIWAEAAWYSWEITRTTPARAKMLNALPRRKRRKIAGMPPRLSIIQVMVSLPW